MKRSALRRKKKLEAGRPKPQLPIERLPAEFFREAAKAQRRCAGCDTFDWPWHSHHVLYEQHLRKAGEPLYDSRNALRLCEDCHAAHHARRAVLPTTSLKTWNLDFLFEVLGPEKAQAYLARYYQNVDNDVRVVKRLGKTE